MGLEHNSVKLRRTVIGIGIFIVTLTVTAVCAAAAGTQETVVYSSVWSQGTVERETSLVPHRYPSELISCISGLTKFSQSSFYMGDKSWYILRITLDHNDVFSAIEKQPGTRVMGPMNQLIQ